jgi:tripartite-type tricarboxylate transporter receptor subunit TctC
MNFRLISSLLLGWLATFAVTAADYPVKPVRVVVPFAAGGSTDLLARNIAQRLSESWKQSVIVDNRAGGGGIVGSEFVVKSAPDGYTMLMGTVTTHAVSVSLYRKLPFDPQRDFTPIIEIAHIPQMLSVHPTIPVRSVKELVALARSRPGQLNFSSGATGSSNWLGGMLFNYYAKVDIVRINYKGAAPAMTAVMSGETQLMFASPGGVVAHVRSGRLRALGVGSTGPSALAPGVPPLAASGVPGYLCETLHAVFAPAGTPAAIVARLHQEIDRYLQSPDGKNLFLKGGVEGVSSTPEQLMTTMKAEMTTLGKVLKAAGVKPE